ncbi:Hypothetical Protein FCC1311_073672 [Hondaea fermentalgiana]|uniref:Uncharacterized protein n=1 Tax=Hondaea fermentalgiana TaxID=2315210 RepID=A0A2R5GJS2_9STRA|nr:Hypothetical Protein FCC1311_073672 [Hondaea fermentalgiana]|eukprot:GBG31146.1 Hypothetical Protein FCC1311_073672 [Hondaea fermentalgiana]
MSEDVDRAEACEEIAAAASEADSLSHRLRAWAREGPCTARLVLELNEDYLVSENSFEEGEEGDGGWLVEIPRGKHLVVIGNRSTLRRGNAGVPAPRKFSFFKVDGGELSIRSLTLRNGEADGCFGGAITVLEGGILRMEGCQIVGCRSIGQMGRPGSDTGGSGGGGGGQGACGGAIFCGSRGSIFLEQCVLKNNLARGGAGGDAFPNRGRFTGHGGAGGGIGGGSGAAALADRGANASQSQSGKDHVAAFGGGGGASQGDYGTDGGNGLWGGGGGGAGGKTMSGWDRVGVPGKGGFGAGDGGRAGARTGSAGGGGGAFGGAICVLNGTEVSIRDCIFSANESQHGPGGMHEWGFPQGRRGTSFGGAIFIKGTPRVHIDAEGSRRLAHNLALRGNNVYIQEREEEVRLAQFLVCKSMHTFAYLIASSVRRKQEREEYSEPASGGALAARSSQDLPLLLARQIIEDFLGWDLLYE